VPVAEYLEGDIQTAFDKLTSKDQMLYLSLHSGHGQDVKNWPSYIHESVPPHERLRIQEQHRARTGKAASLTSIFQTNCMEMNKGAAVFPHAARFNHDCNPNACFTWNAAIRKETMHAMADIPAGDEITISYCDMVHDKSMRAWELKHYGFVCGCRACTGDVRDEDTFAYQSAGRRFRLQELEKETRDLRGANMEAGAQRNEFVGKLVEMAGLHCAEGDYTARLASVYLDIALVCEVRGDGKMAAVTAAKAVQIKRECQGEDFPEYARYEGVLRRMRAGLAC
jgi:hypothetical protein